MCDHITILIGRILNQKVARIEEQAEASGQTLNREDHFGVVNQLVIGALEKILLKGQEDVM